MKPMLLILNDQGGSVMDVSEKVTMTLRAESHQHEPVVCFEPGILSRDCSAGNRAYMDVCSTLRAQMGDNQPAVCFQQNQREEVRNMGEQAGALTADPGMHNTNYIVYPVAGFDAYQHWNWWQSEIMGPLTTGCGRMRGDTPLVIMGHDEK